jgi:hypothetical protein
VRFQTKKDTIVFQVKAWVLGYTPTPLKTSSMRKKKSKLNSQPDRRFGFRQGIVRNR